MANESVAAAFIADMKTKLEAILVPPTWPSTTVYTFAPMDKSISLDDCIVLVAGKIKAPQAYATNVRARDEELEIPMFIQASSVTAGDDGAEALARADALLSEVVALLRDNPPSAGSIPIIGQRKAVVSDAEFYPFPPDGGGWGCGVLFIVRSSVRVA